ncbi:MAG: alpha/beta hydrolase [Clostridia bacterium]|nr:alpha/beta hydrolase [Clostridia bacterium]
MSACDRFIKRLGTFFENSDTKRMSTQFEPDGIEAVFDIDYNGDKNEFHLLDIYYPANAKQSKFPLIIDIHGGAWVYGKKDINKFYAMNLAKEGFAVVNLSYRLLQFDGAFPNNVRDIFDALNWVKDNAEKYPFDMNNIFLTGDSAGGHLAAYTTAISTDSELAEKVGVKAPFQFRSVGYTCGVFDVEVFRKKANISLIRHLHKMFLGNDYKRHPMLDSLTIKNNKVQKFPPVFISTGQQDYVRKQTLNFAKVLEENGLEFELVDFKRKDSTKPLTHVFNVLFPERPESISTNKMMCNFFKENIK